MSATVHGASISRKALNKVLGTPHLVEPLVSTFLGRHLNNGYFRSVYEHAQSAEHVLKIEGPGTFCNVAEAAIWDEVAAAAGGRAWVKDWFVPVKWISGCGRILCMAKAKEYDASMLPDLPTEVPAFLSDVTPYNFGWHDGKWKCLDYGSFYKMIDFKPEMRPVTWSYKNQ